MKGDIGAIHLHSFQPVHLRGLDHENGVQTSFVDDLVDVVVATNDVIIEDIVDVIIVAVDDVSIATVVDVIAVDVVVDDVKDIDRLLEVVTLGCEHRREAARLEEVSQVRSRLLAPLDLVQSVGPLVAAPLVDVVDQGLNRDLLEQWQKE